jgi:hypothetical protein
MADNVIVSAGTGTTIAADEVTDATLGSCKVQYVKLMDGTLDGTNKAAVSAAGLKVDLSGTAANATAIKVDGSSATQPVSGTVSAGLNAGTNIVGKFGIDQTTPGTTNGISLVNVGGTAIAFGNGIANAGCQRVTIASDNTAFTVNATSTGNVASGSSDSGNPVKTGGVARQTNPTAVTDGQRVNDFSDDVGRKIVVLNQCRDLVGSQTTTITSSTTETAIVTAGGAGIFNDLTSLTITNSSATALIVTLKDSTGGTTQGIYALAANGGIALTFPTPKKQATANNNWTLTCGASVASIYVVAEFVKNV